MRDEKHLPSRRPRRRGRGGRPYFGPAVLFFAALFLVTALAWCIPLRPGVSMKEKRELEKFPTFSLSALGDGSYFEQIGLWFSDTFPGRDAWIAADQSIERLYGSSDVVIYGAADNTADAIPVVVPTPVPSAEPTAAPAAETIAQATATPTARPEAIDAGPAEEAIPEPAAEPEPEEEEETWGGVVIEEEDLVSTGAVIQIGDSAYEYTGFSQLYTDAFAAQMNKAAELLDGRCRVFSVFALHGSTIMLPRDFREQIGCSPEEDILEYINSQLNDNVYGVDTFHPLVRHNSEYIYYHTDHHWTALGAWYVYAEWARMAGFEPVGLENYTEGVQEPFYGSLYYKAKQSGRLQVDSVYTYTPPGDIHLFLELNGRDSQTVRGYEAEFFPNIRGTDKYMCFLSGDQPLCTFINNDITDGSACLIVKNSFGNPFVYYYAQHYQYVYVVDYRKYTHRTLTQFVDYYDVDDVVFCLSAGQVQSNGGSQLIKRFVR